VLTGRFPNGCLSLADQDQQPPRLTWMAGQVLFGVFPLASLARDQGKASGLGESPQATAEAARPPQEVGLVEVLFRPLRLRPPGSQPTAGGTPTQVRVEHDAIAAILRAFQTLPLTIPPGVLQDGCSSESPNDSADLNPGLAQSHFRISSFEFRKPAIQTGRPDRGHFLRAQSRKKHRRLAPCQREKTLSLRLRRRGPDEKERSH
jgi:hypothetical protein